MIVKMIMMILVVMIVKIRLDICHKQRLCKIISTRVKFHSVNELGTVNVCIFMFFCCCNIQSCKLVIKY